MQFERMFFLIYDYLHVINRSYIDTAYTRGHARSDDYSHFSDGYVRHLAPVYAYQASGAL